MLKVVKYINLGSCMYSGDKKDRHEKFYVLGLGNQCDTPKIVDFRREKCRGSKTKTY